MYAIYGASGFGREVAPVARLVYGPENLAFVDDGMLPHVKSINDLPVISFDQAVLEKRAISVAVADAGLRGRLAKKCSDAGLHFFRVQAPDVAIYDNVEIGEGAILCSRSMVTSNAKIGKHFHANLFSYIAHDCVIGDFVTFAPRVSCNGNVIIEDGAYIGTGAIIKQGTPERPLRVGAGAIIGMGAVVTKDVPPGVTVVGNPARPLVRR